MIQVGSPLSGWVTPLELVPDPVFAERMLGDGLAIDPVEGRLVAPAGGVIDTVHEAGHALTLRCDGGPTLLMHIGLDTVGLRGEGFTPRVVPGQRVAAGDLLIEFDLDLLARKARSLVTAVIVTDGERFILTSTRREGPVRAGEKLFEAAPTSGGTDASSTSGPTASRTLRIQLAHGLHARPAARLAKAASAFDAQVTFVTEDGRSATTHSPVAILGLGIRHGASIKLQASGPEAAQALAAIVELLDSGMGELLPVTETLAAAPPLNSDEGVPSELRGIAAVPGMAIGPAWRISSAPVPVVEHAEDAEVERGSLERARLAVEAQLEREATGDGVAASVAEAHLAMIGDPVLQDTALQLISAGKTAAFAWRQAIEQSAAPLRTATDPRFAERLDDLLDLERRVLRELLGGRLASQRPPPGAIVLAEALFPSHLAELADAGIAGIATADGGATSHAAIIAAGLGLPMLVGLGPKLALVQNDAELILNHDTLTISPEGEILEAARHSLSVRSARLAAARARASEAAVTADGTHIDVFANLGSVSEASAAVAEGAEGGGLLRTEFLFLDRLAPPDEIEQREAYQAVADALGDRPLIIRLLDIGADKPAPWLPLDPEDNPALGLRGIRLQLQFPDLLETQLRAILAVRAARPLRVMLPMVSAAAEVRQVREVLQGLAQAMHVAPPELGIMVETPAAALAAATLAGDADFFSIGSNDLSQYALARDRTNAAVASGLDGLEPAVLRLIAETVQGAATHSRMVGLCGGLAAVPEAVPVLVGLGVTELSVPTGAIAEVKQIVRSLAHTRCKVIAREARDAPDAAAVRALVAPLLEQTA